MKVLLDTNIIIHRETESPINEDIGHLFRWIDNLGYKKMVHPITIEEIKKNRNKQVVDAFLVKISSYNIIMTVAPNSVEFDAIVTKYDKSENDKNDSLLLKEVFSDRVDILITEDRKIHKKAYELKIDTKVFTIDGFLEKVNEENPKLVDYKVLSVKKDYFGNIDLNDEFFDSFRSDYSEFNRWYNSKSDESAYICRADEKVVAFLYIKKEDESENYTDICPIFDKKKRLKIGTFKVIANGYKIGERFIKIIFDNAIIQKVDEIYVTIFNKTFDQKKLIQLLEEWAFIKHGTKTTKNGVEDVYKRSVKNVGSDNLKAIYPYIPKNNKKYLIPIHPEYHTSLLPDSILRTEHSIDYTDNEPFRNAISKVYISRSISRDLNPGDLLIFYRTACGGPAFYTSVISTIGLVENKIDGIPDSTQFVRFCKKRSVFTDAELLEWWYVKLTRPFIINFIYLYSFPRRLNLQKLIEIGIIKNTSGAPQGLVRITDEQFENIIRETNTDESLIIN
jgi:predicted nucleic acid-binding protein/predicted RNA-binding protein with PUA-like domain